MVADLKGEGEEEGYKMELKQLSKKKDDKLTLEISGCTNAFVNTLRREILEDVPTMAIESVEFRKNDSLLYDEMLSHRLGLMPLKTDLKSYIEPSKCKCEGEGCARCQVSLTLSKKGPCTVYASDFKSKDPKVKPVYPDMIIVKLDKGQEVELEAVAQLGRGKDHMKFSPGHVFYHNKFEFKQEKDIENIDEVLERTPKGVFKKQGKKLIPQDELNSHLWDSCKEFVEPQDAVKIEEKSDEMIFTFEPWGQLSAKETLSSACDNFVEKLDEFKSFI